MIYPPPTNSGIFNSPDSIVMSPAWMLWLNTVGGFKPEFYSDIITVDLSIGGTTHTISKIPFKPSAFLCVAAISGGNPALSIGVASYNEVIGSGQWCVYNNHNAVANQWNTSPSHIGIMVMGAGNLGYWYNAVFGPDFITFTYDKVGVPTGIGTLNLLVFKGV